MTKLQHHVIEYHELVILVCINFDLVQLKQNCWKLK